MIMTREEFAKNTSWKMTYEEYQKCYCPNCSRSGCVHRDAFRRVPQIDGGLALCPNLKDKGYLEFIKDRNIRMNLKYPEDRDKMTEERERQFVEDWFSVYEEEGFSKKFWSPFGDHKDREGQSFQVIGRCTTEDADLSALPMWNIQFKDGTIIGAYPEEIIPHEMRYNGCSLEGLE